MSDELKVEKQDRRLHFLLPIVAVVGVAVITLVIVLAGGGDARSQQPPQIKVELRATPAATIRFRGRDLGRTPLTLSLPRGSDPLDVEATFTSKKVHIQTRHAIVETRVLVKSFVPDGDQSVDFDIKEARRVDIRDASAPAGSAVP
jgi:hypothetical protein